MGNGGLLMTVVTVLQKTANNILNRGEFHGK
jgi:hypothetical protein